MRALNIASCIDSMSVSGGTELNAVRTVEALVERGHSIVVATLTADTEGMTTRYLSAGAPVFRFPVSSLFGRHTRKQVSLAAQLFRDQKVDVVHTHDRYSNFLMVAAARMAGIPVLASRRWTRYSERRYFFTDLVAYRRADAVLANSDLVAASLARRQFVNPAKVVVVPNFLDTEVFTSAVDRDAWREKYGFSADDIVLVIVAQLRPVKNHLLLLAAFGRAQKREPRLRLLIVGDGMLRERIAKEVSARGFQSSVVLTGHMPQAWRSFAAADIAVLPSAHEGFPNSLIEAMGVGVAVVASAVGGVPDVVVHGDNGLLIEPNRVDELSSAIITLAGNATLRVAMASKAKVRAHRDFGREAAIDKLETVYAALAGGESNK